MFPIEVKPDRKRKKWIEKKKKKVNLYSFLDSMFNFWSEEDI